MLTSPVTDRRVLADVWDQNLRSRAPYYAKMLAGVLTPRERSTLRRLEKIHAHLLGLVAKS